jgi:hypothetical protein
MDHGCLLRCRLNPCWPLASASFYLHFSGFQLSFCNDFFHSFSIFHVLQEHEHIYHEPQVAHRPMIVGKNQFFRATIFCHVGAMHSETSC